MKLKITITTITIALSFFFTTTAFSKNKWHKIDTQSFMKNFMYADCHPHGSTLLTRVTFDANETNAKEACEARGLLYGYPPSPIAVKCQQKGSLTYIIQYASPELSYAEVCGFEKGE